MPDAFLRHAARLLTLTVTCVTLAACAAPEATEVVTELRPRIPAERRDDLQLTAWLADGSDRRAMRGAADIGVWLDAWWSDRDPTPGTDVNEALQVYRMRAAWLLESQPEVPFGEWSDRWGLFLRYGLPDQTGPEYIPWRREEGGRARTPARIVQVSREVWRYRSPASFTLTLRAEYLLPDPQVDIPDLPPSLEGDWEALESPVSSVIDRRQALLDISWYGLPSFAERLLRIPGSRLTPLGELRDEAFERMTRRMAYLHGRDGARRLAALSALGVEAAYLLGRAAAPPYTTELLAEDLQRFGELRFRLPRSPRRGPHPEIWSDPGALLERLAQEHPDPGTLTGWDWQGDMLLAMGPPALLDEQNRTAYYLWGTPEALGIGDTQLGWVETVRLGDMLSDFVRDAEASAARRREEAQNAAADLTGVLTGRSGESSSAISPDMLRRLNELVPPNVFRAGIPNAPGMSGVGELLPITVDVVTFPANGDSVEVQASFGIPAASVGMREEEAGYRTELRANLVLVDYQLHIVQALSRQGGYRIAGRADISRQVFLDTFRFLAPEGSYVLYLSAEDPAVTRSGGVLTTVDVAAVRNETLSVSTIMLAADITQATGPGKFVRGDYQILPVPSRQFFYGQDLHFYYEVEHLTRSEVGDYVWDEAYYIIPEAEGEGIVRINPEDDMTGLQSTAERTMAIDLSSMAEAYEGGVFLVVMVTDRVSGEQAVSATRFSLYRPPGGPGPVKLPW